MIWVGWLMPKIVAPKGLKNNSNPNIELSPPDQKWFHDQIKARGLLKKDVAAAFGIHPNKVWMMISGEKGIRPHEIIRWAEVLALPLPLVWRKFGLPWPAATVPLAGSIRADGRLYFGEGDRIAPAPDIEPGDLVALHLDHERPALGYRRGTLFYYRPRDRVDVSAVGRLAVVGLGDQPAPLIGVLDAAALGRVRVVLLGGVEVVDSAEAISASPVEWIRAG